MTEEPLKPGEHVDLDSGARVHRARRTAEAYEEFLISAGDGRVTVSRDDLRAMAELAGFEVTDPQTDGGDDPPVPWG